VYSLLWCTCCCLALELYCTRPLPTDQLLVSTACDISATSINRTFGAYTSFSCCTCSLYSVTECLISDEVCTLCAALRCEVLQCVCILYCVSTAPAAQPDVSLSLVLTIGLHHYTAVELRWSCAMNSGQRTSLKHHLCVVLQTSVVFFSQCSCNSSVQFAAGSMASYASVI
jgi:hypothetical protein